MERKLPGLMPSAAKKVLQRCGFGITEAQNALRYDSTAFLLQERTYDMYRLEDAFFKHFDEDPDVMSFEQLLQKHCPDEIESVKYLIFAGE